MLHGKAYVCATKVHKKIFTPALDNFWVVWNVTKEISESFIDFINFRQWQC